MPRVEYFNYFQFTKHYFPRDLILTQFVEDLFSLNPSHVQLAQIISLFSP